MSGNAPTMNRSGYVPASVQPGETAQALPVDVRRIGLVLTNSGANPCKIAFGNETSAEFGYPLAAGASLQWQNPLSCPKEYLSVYSALGTTLDMIITDWGQDV